jgi:hypothetical protein
MQGMGKNSAADAMKIFASCVYAAILTALCGCVEHDSQSARGDAGRRVIETAPVPAVPPSEEVVAAENAYRACLVRAARYLDQGSSDVQGLAALIAPLCYPQFSSFEAAAAANFSDRDRRVFDHAGDQRQIDLAGDAIRTERSQAALSSAGTAHPPP